jgi:ABC-three component (ABC-3C) system Middle Component 3
VTAWAERPRVKATLLNPALVAVLLAAAARDYETEAAGMPWPLAFLVPPLILHRPTRDALPRNTRTHLSTWIRRHPLLRAGFPNRAAAMVPITREGIRFGLRAGVLARHGAALTGHLAAEPPAGELRQLVRRAALVGRWLAKTDQPSTVFALLGVAP